MEGVRHVYSVDLLSVVEQGSLPFETSVSYSPLILHEFTVSAGKVMEAFQGFAMGYLRERSSFRYSTWRASYFVP